MRKEVSIARRSIDAVVAGLARHPSFSKGFGDERWIRGSIPRTTLHVLLRIVFRFNFQIAKHLQSREQMLRGLRVHPSKS
jgi:hypothetical protein